MKKFALILLIALVPLSFMAAEISFGPQTVYFGDATQIANGSIDSTQLAYGAEARFKFFLLRADYSFLYLGTGEVGGPRFLLPVDCGLNLDLWIVGASLGFGSNLYMAPGSGTAIGLWDRPFNLKATADILLGKHLSVGAEAYYFFGYEEFSAILADPSILASIDPANIIFAATAQLRF